MDGAVAEGSLRGEDVARSRFVVCAGVAETFAGTIDRHSGEGRPGSRFGLGGGVGKCHRVAFVGGSIGETFSSARAKAVEASRAAQDRVCELATLHEIHGCGLGG